MNTLYLTFSRLLEYPSRDLYKFLESKDIQELKKNNDLNKFVQKIHGMTLSQLEEIYTRTFDLQAICYPYAGYQLFGEDYRRGEFMTKLKEHYKSNGFHPPENELPDHISVIFQYLSVVSDDVIKEECLIPVFEKFLKSFPAEAENPYYFLLKAIYEEIKSELTDKSSISVKQDYIQGGTGYE
jgi:nitrate reductase delta subunit